MTNHPTLTDEIIIDHLNELCHRFAGQPALVERLQGLMRIIRQRIADNARLCTTDEEALAKGLMLESEEKGENVVITAARQIRRMRIEMSALRAECDHDAVSSLVGSVREHEPSPGDRPNPKDWLYDDQGRARLKMEDMVVPVEFIARFDELERLVQSMRRDEAQPGLKPAGGNGIASSW